MKSMILAATAMGTVIAGLILFFKSKTHPHERLADGMTKTLDKMNSGAPHLERGQHAMG